MSVTALFYNWGFFTLLGYAPYPMGLSAHQLGLVFTAWGLLVALFSVAGAPRLQRRFGTAPTLYANLVFLAVVLGAIGLFTGSPTVVIVATIASGAFIGINNTLTTQAVMTVAPVERPVASAAYGFVRFIGGGLAPFVAGKLAEHYNIHLPFLMGGVSFLIAIAVLATGHRILAAAEAQTEEPVTEPAPVGEILEVARNGAGEGRPIVVAVDNSDVSGTVTTRAIEIANARHAPVDLVHVHEISVVADETVDRESLEDAHALVRHRLDQLAEGGVDAVGHLLRTVADHGSAGRLIAEHANAVGAQLLVIGDGTSGALARLLGQASTQQLLADVDSDVLVVEPDPTDTTVRTSAF
jgi:nucleotide-binding universal stress UspA family protein